MSEETADQQNLYRKRCLRRQQSSARRANAEEVSEEISEPTEESMSQQEFLIMEHKELSSTEIKNNLTLKMKILNLNIYIVYSVSY